MRISGMGRVSLFLFLFFVPFFAGGQDTLPEKRLALVIGNGDYLSGPLANPVNDARSMARALRKVGFDVILRENVSNQTEMKRVIREFGDRLRGYDVGMFYYAGHGIQKDGYNFLVPVNARINDEEEVEYECVDAGYVVAMMDAADSRVNIVVLDACRNNPYARTFRSTRQGLVSMNAPAGTIIAYATSPGKTALDGSGVNGLYTQELLYQIQRPGLKIEDVFKNVRIEVMRKSNRQQVPWESSSLTGDFYFRPTQEQMMALKRMEEEKAVGQVLFWKAGTHHVTLRRGDREINDPRTYPFGDDLIAEDPLTHEKYLLRNFWKNRDGRYRPAEKLPPTMADFYETAGMQAEAHPAEKPEKDTPGTLDSRMAFEMKYKARWKADRSGNFSFVVGVMDVTDKIEYKLIKGKHLWIYYPGNDAHYLIKDIKKQLGNRWHEIYPTDKFFEPAGGMTAPVVDSKGDQKEMKETVSGKIPDIRWKAYTYRNSTVYFLYVDGKEISKETHYKLVGNDLYVFHPRTGRTFLLENFVHRQDNVLRRGILLTKGRKK